MTVTLAQLRALDAVARHGSFSAAADALRVSQPAVSGTVKALEVEVGGAVVDRSSGGRPVVLTPLGHALLPHARTALDALAGLTAAAAEHRGAPHGVVRLAVVTSVRAGLVPQLLRRVAEELPAVTVELLEGDDPEMPDWLDAGLADVAVLINPEPRDLGPGAVELPGDALCAVVPAGHALAARSSVHLEELVADRLLASGGGCQVQLRELHRTCGLPFRPVAEVAGLRSLLAMVARGDGVAVVPELAAPLVPSGAHLVPLVPELRRRLVLTGAPSGVAGGSCREQHPLVEPLLALFRP
ncbi:DNA-binding transcriptional regulator, LysR family [Quadrisphaera granulorum]|uniref:DNA-binding transcriptional LysR family regulator n=1 Tax=Quadrisphaera granulorum TaxID=317664 RepID=A0A315ZQE3_9ACTN|nr:LysR family transcriptional regulator [Quadrisphaera granulorum]PWJ47118.1 DNA-binding transcriptional LysR family regulator [Quadrisphaera granulorum]SZE98922.1 DNA-binding transcriptional regulator, LysR family [Quadrisphaera granulorum]